MENLEQILKATVGELDRLLDAKNVLGGPIEKDGVTIVPLVSYGFGFGAGGSTDEKRGKGGGTGGAGGIKPVGAIIIDKGHARVEAVRGMTTGVVEAIGEAAAHVMERSTGNKSKGPQQDRG